VRVGVFCSTQLLFPALNSITASMPAPILQLTRIAQVAICAKDVATAAVFYRDVLGFRHLFDAGAALSFLECGGVRIMLTQPSSPEFDHPSSVLYFPVPDLEAAHEALVAAGVTIESAPRLIARMPDHELWMCFFRDPAGNMLALMSERAVR
jgi:methylmalonyl-CoA/ethylmalonyl-CoA epimerase